MGAQTESSRVEPDGVDDLNPFDRVQSAPCRDAAPDAWAEPAAEAPTRREQVMLNVFMFGLQGVCLFAVIALLATIMVFVPFCSDAAWAALKTAAAMEAISYVVVGAALSRMVDWGRKSARDGA